MDFPTLVFLVELHYRKEATMASKRMDTVQEYAIKMESLINQAHSGAGHYLKGKEGEVWQTFIEAWLAVRDYEEEE